MRKISRILLLIAFICSGTNHLLAQWVQTGGPEGGYVSSLAEDDTFLYAATFGPVFRMHRGDTTWTPLNELNSRVSGASCLALSGTTLVAGAGRGGVYRSTDHGVTWQRWISGLDHAESVFSLAVNGNDLFAGTDRGVYLSTDHGASWTPANAGQDSLLVLCLLVKDSNLFAGTLGGGVYRSSDYGTSWTPVNNGLTSDSVWVWSLAVIDSALFAGTWFAEGVYRSTDNGANWTAVNYGLLNPDVNTLAVLGTTLFAGTHGGVFLSKDWGNSWTRLDPEPGSIVNCFHISGTHIFAGAFDGVHFSTNTGDSWISANAGLINTVINTFVRDGTNLFAGTTHSGLFLSIDGGSNWVKTSLTAAYVSSLVVSPNGAGGTNLFAGTSLGVSRSTDSGTHWTISIPRMTAGGIQALVVIPSGTSGSNLFAGTDSDGVFLSTNNGDSWRPVNVGLSDTTIRCLAVSGSNLFAGTGSGAFLSTNNGANWTPVNNGLTDTPVQCLAASGGNLFAGTDNGGVFLSTNSGTTWTPVNTGLTDLNVLSLAAKGTRVFAGTWFDGVFLSQNNGTTWTRVDTELRALPVLSLEFGATDLFAGTRGAGVWRRPLSDMVTSMHLSSSDVPSEFRLEPNFPNPFNPNTTISYDLPKSSSVSLKIFNTLGQLVATLVDERKELGYYTVQWNASNVPSGIYFYRLQAGEFVETRKMVLIK